jgi:hypothetical protein
VVNVCARLEQNADVGEVLVGERTAQMAGAALDFDELRRIDVKGKREPVACRRLLRALSLMRPRGIAGLPSVFAGRDRELDVLREAFESAIADRRPQLVTIVGDAGVGKSRLVRELWADLGVRGDEALVREALVEFAAYGLTWHEVETERLLFGE